MKYSLYKKWNFFIYTNNLVLYGFSINTQLLLHYKVAFNHFSFFGFFKQVLGPRSKTIMALEKKYLF